MWGGGRSSRSRTAKASGVRQQPQQTFEAVIPGASASGEADGDDWVRKGLDMAVAYRLANFRAKYPVRGQVTWTNKMRPGRSEQVPWDHYRQFRAGKTARVDQEWWMPPLLVPLANKTAVGLSGDEALWQGPASGGGQRVVEHYTNIHRIEKLALEHPLVVGVVRSTKPSATTIFNKIGRAVKGHQSEWNLRLHANHDVLMDVGVTANEASADLLSLWWMPAGNTRFNQEQESLARAVFMDVAEGYHLTPDTYAAELRELDRDRAGATGGASAASGTPQEPPAAASGGAGSSTDWYRVAGGAPSGNGPQSTAAAASAAPTRGVVPAQLAPVPPPHFPPVPLRPPASSAAAAQPALSESSALPTWPPPQPGPASGMGSPHSAPLDPDRCLPFLPKEAATSPAARHTAARHPAPPVVWPQAASETSAPPRAAPLGPASSGGLRVSAETAGPAMATTRWSAVAGAGAAGAALQAAMDAQLATAPKPPPRTFPVNAQLAEPPVQAASPSPPSAQQAPASVRPAPEAHATAPPPKEAQLAGPELPPQLSASRTPNWAEGESTAAEAARSSDKGPRGLPLSSTPPELADRRQEEEEIQFELESEAAESEAAESKCTQTRWPPPALPPPSREERADDEQDPGAASGALDAGDTRDVDLTQLVLPFKRLAVLSDKQKASLRQVGRVEPAQWHIADHAAAWHRRIAGSGREWRQHEPGQPEYVLRELLARFCDRVPSCNGFVEGIPHKNDRADLEGKLWDVARALGSRKVHHMGRLQRRLWPDPDRAEGWPTVPFHDAYPDAVFGEGYNALADWAFLRTKALMGCPSDFHYMRHILNKHDGEVRHWGARTWEEVPGDVDIYNLRFWHYQFAKDPEVRRHLYRRYHENKKREGRISTWEIDWILDREKGGATNILKRVPGPASGGTWQWYIVSGQFVTLAELFDHGSDLCSCAYLYRLYLGQQIFIGKQHHSKSGSADSTFRINARNFQWHERGYYRGLPS